MLSYIQRTSITETSGTKQNGAAKQKLRAGRVGPERREDRLESRLSRCLLHGGGPGSEGVRPSGAPRGRGEYCTDMKRGN